MSVVDKEEDVVQLENIFGKIPIEIFIRNLADQFEIINIYRTMKPWEKTKEEIRKY